jgi:ketosteroid isomerase-like protein
MNAYNSGEAVNLMPMYTPDANYISSHVPGLVARGREKVGENFQRGMSGGGHIDTIVVLGASVSCNLAYVRSRYEANNDGRKAVGQNMIVLKRISGKWLIKEHMTAVLE